ncbi:cation transporter [Lacrimispora sp.]|uniref:cation transporter n=1 Tax=Lacrimispora sp. TaxID=2719234 RepID=UPI003FA60278
MLFYHLQISKSTIKIKNLLKSECIRFTQLYAMVSLLARLLIKDYKNTSLPSVQKAYAKLCSVFGILLNVLLFTVKLFSGLISGSTAIITPQNIEFSWIILFLLICSILVKLYMFFYNRNIACKINSSAMKATASDCISDMAATSAIMISLIVQHLSGGKLMAGADCLFLFLLCFQVLNL